jgi:hypothetical protein
LLLQLADVVDDAEASEQLLVQAQVKNQAELAKRITDTRQKVERWEELVLVHTVFKSKHVCSARCNPNNWSIS